MKRDRPLSGEQAVDGFGEVMQAAAEDGSKVFILVVRTSGEIITFSTMPPRTQRFVVAAWMEANEARYPGDKDAQ
jgi:hypothetical protein